MEKVINTPYHSYPAKYESLSLSYPILDKKERFKDENRINDPFVHYDVRRNKSVKQEVFDPLPQPKPDPVEVDMNPHSNLPSGKKVYLTEAELELLQSMSKGDRWRYLDRFFESSLDILSLKLLPLDVKVLNAVKLGTFKCRIAASEDYNILKGLEDVSVVDLLASRELLRKTYDTFKSLVLRYGYDSAVLLDVTRECGSYVNFLVDKISRVVDNENRKEILLGLKDAITYLKTSGNS